MAKPSPSFAGDPALVSLGKALRHKRSMLGMSQEGLALLAELDRSYVGGIERGEHNVAIINLIRLADALGINASELLDSAGL